MEQNLWNRVLDRLRAQLEPDEFRRWFNETSYASDSGDQVTVWVPSASVARHLQTRYIEQIEHALTALGRIGTAVRFVPTGIGDEDE